MNVFDIYACEFSIENVNETIGVIESFKESIESASEITDVRNTIGYELLFQNMKNILGIMRFYEWRICYCTDYMQAICDDFNTMSKSRDKEVIVNGLDEIASTLSLIVIGEITDFKTKLLKKK